MASSSVPYRHARFRPTYRSDIVNLYRPTPCTLWLYLRANGVSESEAGAFDQIIQRLGDIHEREHLATLGTYEDIGLVGRDQRVSRTLEAIGNRVPVIYQPEFAHEVKIGGSPVVVVGRPGFLIFDGNGYIIRDSLSGCGAREAIASELKGPLGRTKKTIRV